MDTHLFKFHFRDLYFIFKIPVPYDVPVNTVNLVRLFFMVYNYFLLLVFFELLNADYFHLSDGSLSTIIILDEYLIVN